MRDGDVYEGPWENGRHAEGEAFITYQNGDLYRGGYAQSLRHGQGRMEYAHGNVFDGTWVRGSGQAGYAPRFQGSDFMKETGKMRGPTGWVR